MPGLPALEFGRELRLLAAKQFQQVFDQPTRASAPQLTLLARANDLGHPRIGFVISRKNIRRAHERNRIKRLAREHLRLHQHQLPAVDLILLAKKGAQDLDNKELVDLLEGLWRTLIRRLPAC